MQIKLKPPVFQNMFGEASNDPEAIEEGQLTKTYGKSGKLNIYTMDRKATVNSFKCYWMIDTMIRTRQYMEFPSIEVSKIIIEKVATSEDNQMSGQNLKKEFILPTIFTNSSL